jgi:hypothetical protein
MDDQKPDEGSVSEGDPEDALRGLLKAASPLGDEAWAREHVQVTATPFGRSAFRYLAQIKADGLVFEGRTEGEAGHARAHEQRAIDEAVAAYVEFVTRAEN